MKKIFFCCFFSFVGLFSSLGAMTEAKEAIGIQTSAHTDEKTNKAPDFSLEIINANLAKIKFMSEFFSLEFGAPFEDPGKSTLKTINLFYGTKNIGNILYSVPKPYSKYNITFFRKIKKLFTNNGLGMILAIVALDDALKISKCSDVSIISTTEASVKSLTKFGFTKEGEELPVNFRTNKLPEFMKTTAPKLLEEAFAKLIKAAQ